MQLIIKKQPVFNCFTYTSFRVAMLALAGERVKVETEFLFSDQYNIAKISKRRARRLLKTVPSYYRNYLKAAENSLTETGLRVHDRHVKQVINDAREGRQRCNWCGKHSEAVGFYCPHCGKTEYLSSFQGYFCKKVKAA